MIDAIDTRVRSGATPLEDGITLLPVVGILAGESFVFAGDLQVAVWIHLLTLLGCLFAPLRYPGETATFQAIALVPVFRLVTLGMPVFFDDTLLWLPTVYVPFLLGIAVLYWGNVLPRVDVGWRPALALLPALVLASAVFAEVEYQLLTPTALVPAWTLSNALALGIVMVGVVGLVEELLFRGILQRSLQSRFGRWSGLGLSSVIFAAMHAGFASVDELGFALAFGLLVGVLYDLTDSMAALVVIHGLTNVFLFGLIPLFGPLLAV